jgi:hypothetical protein
MRYRDNQIESLKLRREGLGAEEENKYEKWTLKLNLVFNTSGHTQIEV